MAEQFQVRESCLNVGQFVSVYGKPYTREDFEGTAKLTRFVSGEAERFNGKTCRVERWTVQFSGGYVPASRLLVIETAPVEMATHRLIDSVWTIKFRRVADGAAEIINYDRTTADGYEREKELPRCSLNQSADDRRTVISLTLSPYERERHWAALNDDAAEVLRVTNPAYIFSFNGNLLAHQSGESV